MKYYYLPVLLFSLFVNAQRADIDEGLRSQLNYSPNIALPESKTDVQGTPYYDEEYKVAEIFDNDAFIGKSIVRYNGISDEIEFKEAGKVYVIEKSDNLEVKTADKVYKIYSFNGKKRYFIKFNNFDSALLLKPKKRYIEKVKSNSGYEKDSPAKYVKKYKYFIVLKDKEIQEVRLKKKDVLKVLEDKKTEIEKFVSLKKLSYKKEKDVVKIMNHYNTL